MNETDLLDRWLEGELDSDQHLALERRLVSDPAFARTATLAAGDRWNLRECLRAIDEDRPPSSRPPIAARGSRRIRRRGRGRSSRRRWLGSGAIVAVAVAAVLVLAVGLSREAELLDAGERIVVVGGPAGELGRELAPETSFQAPADLVLGSAGGTFVLEFAAGGRLRYRGGGDAPLVIDLAAGSLVADVAPRPAHAPLVVETPDARLEVVGTGFTIAYHGERTAVTVHEGVVRMRDRATGAVSLVEAGDEWTAGSGDDQPPPPAPALELTVDEAGAVTAAGPALGDLAVSDLPAGGRLAVGSTHTSSGTGRELMAALRAGAALSLVVDATLEVVPTGEFFVAEVVIPQVAGGERAWDLFQLRVPATAVVKRDLRGRYALTWDGEALAVVVGGERVSRRQFNGAPDAWTTPLQLKLVPDLGAGQEGTVRIHRVRIFDRRLEPDEIAALPGP